MIVDGNEHGRKARQTAVGEDWKGTTRITSTHNRKKTAAFFLWEAFGLTNFGLFELLRRSLLQRLSFHINS